MPHALGAFSSRNASGTVEDLKAGDVRHLRRINFFWNHFYAPFIFFSLSPFGQTASY